MAGQAVWTLEDTRHVPLFEGVERRCHDTCRKRLSSFFLPSVRGGKAGAGEEGLSTAMAAMCILCDDSSAGLNVASDRHSTKRGARHEVKAVGAGGREGRAAAEGGPVGEDSHGCGGKGVQWRRELQPEMEAQWRRELRPGRRATCMP